MGMTWFEKAAEEIDRDLENGDIDSKEHARQLRDLRQEMREEAQEAAERAYNDALGFY